MMANEKEIDSHKLVYHPKRVSEWLEKDDCYPIYVEIEPINKCNHNCIFCGLDWARGDAIIDTQVLLKALEDMGKNKVKSVCFAGAGEPLLHPDFVSFVKKAKESGIDVSFSTNAVLFDEKKAEQVLPYTSWIRFSVNAGTPETYSKVHRCAKENFSKVIENISKAVEIKKKNGYKTSLGVQIVLLPENASEVLELGKICKKIGVDTFQIKPYSQNPNSFNKHAVDYFEFENLKNEVEKLDEQGFKVIYRATRIERIAKGKNYPICHGLCFFAIITAKGNVSPCNFYFNNPDFSYGNLNNESFSEIWEGKRRKEVLAKLHSLGVNDCETGCRLDLINSYLNRLKNPSPFDNFP